MLRYPTLQIVFMVLWIGAQGVRAYGVEYRPVSLAILRPAAAVVERFEEDGPFEQYALAADGSLWLLGKSALWSWYPLTASMKRIDLSAEVSLLTSTTDQRAIVSSANSILIATNGRVWRFLPSQSKIQALAGKLPAKCLNLQFLGGGHTEDLLLKGNCGGYAVDIKNLRIQPLKLPETMIQATFFAWNPETAAFVGVLDKDLLQFERRNDSYEVNRIYKAKSKLLGVSFTGDAIAAWTSQALMGFDSKTARRLQVVPVSGSRRIWAAVFRGDRHVILFQDGATEIMVPSSRKSWTSKLQVKEANQGDIIVDPGGAFAVLKDQPIPMVVSFERLEAKLQ